METTEQHRHLPLHGFDEEAALRSILEGTAKETGERFFTALVENLARALHTHGAWVTEYLEDCRRLRALAFWLGGEWIRDYEQHIDGTPCEAVIEGARLVHLPDNVLALYPDDPDIKKVGAVSYMGVPLLDMDGKVLGHLAVLDTRPMPEEPRALAIFQIFAARAAAELQRMRAETAVQEREAKLGRLVDSAMDAILELDQHGRVTRVNPAAEKVFHSSSSRMVGRSFLESLKDESREKLQKLRRDLETRPEGQAYLWIPGGLSAVNDEGETFSAEATISRFEMHRQMFYTVILRDVNDRIEAERKIRSLTVETEYLREEIKALHNDDTILGTSEPIVRMLDEIQQVANTEATVLILGETGTGKELVARAIHGRSRRHDKPLIRVNCAAIPASLVESEFFGHERGAFTGATAKREGRFALADGGTIFLDEIGELPLDLQSKLLRVLQEGEFEPVGSSRTRKVDVRVLAATNRDLQQAVQAGRFREDLYYRLNVFPISVPPLRERGEDLVTLASAFAQQFARRMGRTLEPLSSECVRRLRGYSWPGNVRELQNVIERAVITAKAGRLDLARSLPDPGETMPPAEPAPPSDESAHRIRTAQELEALERENLIRALDATGWRVSGDHGAARLLGMPPSTLSSRLKTLGIKRPRSASAKCIPSWSLHMRIHDRHFSSSFW